MFSTRAQITIDGSIGEGGGQVLRTSLTLSLITRKSFALENIRSRRQKRGLLGQHLKAVKAVKAAKAAAEIGKAMSEGLVSLMPLSMRELTSYSATLATFSAGLCGKGGDFANKDARRHRPDMLKLLQSAGEIGQCLRLCKQGGQRALTALQLLANLKQLCRCGKIIPDIMSAIE